MWLGPLPLLSLGGGRGHTSAPHWVCSRASPNKQVANEKQAHAMVKTKNLLSYWRVYSPSAFLLKSVTSEAPVIYTRHTHSV